jgi:polyhydroxyalkanoate synthesis regulator phasin
MDRNALLRQYLDAGVQFTQMTRERAESIVKDFVEAGEVRRKQANRLVDDLVDRSRANVDQFLDTVRQEVRDQVALLEVVSKEAIGRLEDQVGQLRSQVEALLPDGVGLGGLGRTPARPAAKKAAAKKSTAKKTTAKKKATAKKATAKKSTAKKSTAKKSTTTTAAAPTTTPTPPATPPTQEA